MSKTWPPRIWEWRGRGRRRAREAGRAAAWTLLVAVGLDRAWVERRGKEFASRAEAEVRARAGRLVKALRECEQGRISSLAGLVTTAFPTAGAVVLSWLQPILQALH